MQNCCIKCICRDRRWRQENVMNYKTLSAKNIGKKNKYVVRNVDDAIIFWRVEQRYVQVLLDIPNSLNLSIKLTMKSNQSTGILGCTIIRTVYVLKRPGYLTHTSETVWTSLFTMYRTETMASSYNSRITSWDIPMLADLICKHICS